MAEHREVDIKDLIILAEFQMRDGLDLKRVGNLREAYNAGDNVPPITVAKVDGVLILVDGFHRVAALGGNAWPEPVRADVHTTTRQGALRMAARANLTPGKPVTRVERRKAFRTYIENKGHHEQGRVAGRRKPMKTYGNLARELGLGKTTVIRWMQEDFPQVHAVLGRTLDRDSWKRRAMGTWDERAASSTREGLGAALRAFKSVRGRSLRGDLIHEAEALVQEMKARGAYKKYEPRAPADF